MRIVTFSTANKQNTMFSDEKVSLRKLSQVKALNNVEYYQQKSQTISKPVENKQIKKQSTKRQSHIKWVNPNDNSSIQPMPQYISHTIATPKQQPHKPSSIRQASKSPLRTGRRKIFGSLQHSSKQNMSIPTFSRVPEMITTNRQHHQGQQQTQYYSMIVNDVNSPKNRNSSKQLNTSNLLLGSNVYESPKEYNSPFVTNMENSKLQSYTNHNINSLSMLSSNNNTNKYIDRSSIIDLTQHNIPKLQKKLKQHDQQLTTIKNYLKNTEKLHDLKQSIKEFQQIQSLTIKQDQIQNRRLMLMNQIQTAKLKQAQLRKKSNQQANYTIQHIEEQRIKRLDKIKKQNQKLKQNLQQIDYLPSHSDIPDDNDDDQYYYQKKQQYLFQGPIAFPSKDWDSQQQFNQPISKSFQRSHEQYSINNFSNYRQRGYKTTDVEMYNSKKTVDKQISPVMRKKMNQISSIGFSNNKTEQFSMQANTFRDFTSPLDFQGDNQLW